VDLPKLPEAKKLLHNIQPYHSTLYKDSHTLDYHNSFNTTSDELNAAQSILDSFHAYTFWLVDKLRAHYVKSNLKIEVARNRELLNASFVESVSSNNKEFVKTFLSTQHFSVFSETLAGDTYRSKSPPLPQH